jgi:hypothetical protein
MDLASRSLRAQYPGCDHPVAVDLSANTFKGTTMRRTIGTITALVLLASAASWRVAPAQGVDVQGAWIVAGITDSSGKEIGGEPGLFVFTGTHYSIMFVPGTNERAQYSGEDPTDGEMLAAYGSFIANSGRYVVEGDQLTHRAYVAKDPVFMGDFPDNPLTAKVHRAGDTLHFTYTSGFLKGSMFTLQRVEGRSFPSGD